MRACRKWRYTNQGERCLQNILTTTVGNDDVGLKQQGMKVLYRHTSEAFLFVIVCI